MDLSPAVIWCFCYSALLILAKDGFSVRVIATNTFGSGNYFPFVRHHHDLFHDEDNNARHCWNYK